jgi:hypothetical protein
MPGPPVGVQLSIGGVRERAVCLLPVRQRCRPVDGRTRQRMPEPHPRAELNEPGLHGARRRPGRDAEPGRGPPHQRRVTGRIGRGQQQEPPGLRWQSAELPPEALLDLPRQRHPAGQPEPARQLIGRQSPRQLQQGQGITVRLGDDPLAHPRVHRAGEHRIQQRPRVALPQARHRHLRQPGQFLARIASTEDQAHRLGRQPAGHESEDLRGHAIQPLLVIDHAHQRAVPRYLRQQAQHGQTGEELVRRCARADAERGPQRITLRRREPVEVSQHRRAQLVQPGEREFHLRLHADGAHHPAPRRVPGQVVEQRCLAHAGLTAHHQHLARACPYRLDQPVKHAAFAAAPPQRRGASFPRQVGGHLTPRPRSAAIPHSPLIASLGRIP